MLLLRLLLYPHKAECRALLNALSFFFQTLEILVKNSFVGKALFANKKCRRTLYCLNMSDAINFFFFLSNASAKRLGNKNNEGITGNLNFISFKWKLQHEANFDQTYGMLIKKGWQLVHVGHGWALLGVVGRLHGEVDGLHLEHHHHGLHHQHVTR